MKGVLKKLHNPEVFRKVYIDKDAGTVAWPEDLHIDPDTLYNRGIEINEVENLSKAYNELKSSEEWKDIIILKIDDKSSRHHPKMYCTPKFRVEI